MDQGSSFEEERYTDSRYILEVVFAGLGNGLHVGVADRKREREENQ